MAYRFTESWEAEDIAPWFELLGSETYVQVDDYKGYSTEVERPDGTKAPVVPPERRLGCMMHVRRRFYDALKLGDKRAAKPIGWIKKIYEFEAQGKEKPPSFPVVEESRPRAEPTAGFRR